MPGPTARERIGMARIKAQIQQDDKARTYCDPKGEDSILRSLGYRNLCPQGQPLPIVEAGLPIGAAVTLGKAALKSGLLTKAKTKILSLFGRKAATTAAATAAPAVTGAMLKQELLTKAQQLIRSPTRTLLPYVTAGGLVGAAVDLGDYRETKAEEKGRAISTLVTPPIPPVTPQTVFPPAPLLSTLGERRMPQYSGLVEPQFVRRWSTGTTEFGVDIEGKRWVLTKKGWKRYSARKPIVLGTKNLTPGKFIQAAKKYHKMYKDLDKIFKKVRIKKRRT